MISDVHVESSWNLGWGENSVDAAVEKVIDMIIKSIKKKKRYYYARKM